MSKIIVTGGAGFIGYHLCKRLLDEGHTVICVDNLISGSQNNVKPFEENKNYTFLRYDVINPLPEDLSADFVFHLASPASPNHHSSVSYHALPMETMMVNTQGTHNLLEFALKNNARFLFTSTSEIYGDPLEHPQKETYRGNVSTTGPRSVYDESKRFGETLCAYYNRDKGLDVRIARIFNTYGPNMLVEDKRMIVEFILEALKGENITVFGDGKQTRSLCFVEDTVDGLMKLMFTDGLSGEVVNVGAEEEHTVLEYAQIVKELTSSSSEIKLSEQLPKDDPLRRKTDISKARQILSWEPKVPLKEGLAKMIEYYKNL